MSIKESLTDENVKNINGGGIEVFTNCKTKTISYGVYLNGDPDQTILEFFEKLDEAVKYNMQINKNNPAGGTNLNLSTNRLIKKIT